MMLDFTINVWFFFTAEDCGSNQFSIISWCTVTLVVDIVCVFKLNKILIKYFCCQIHCQKNYIFYFYPFAEQFYTPSTCSKPVCKTFSFIQVSALFKFFIIIVSLMAYNNALIIIFIYKY